MVRILIEGFVIEIFVDINKDVVGITVQFFHCALLLLYEKNMSELLRGHWLVLRVDL